VDYADRTLTCFECGEEFLFSAGEQRFFAQKNLLNEPRRCKKCQASRRAARSSGGSLKNETIAVCAQCGKQTTVPFRPTQGRPVYCRECYQHRDATGAGAS